jgi:hypothetical protein
LICVLSIGIVMSLQSDSKPLFIYISVPPTERPTFKFPPHWSNLSLWYLPNLSARQMLFNFQKKKLCVHVYVAWSSVNFIMPQESNML